MSSQSSNKVLLHRISADSDKAAFAELFRRYHSKLVSFATCFLPNYEEAEDMVSEVFIRLLQNREQLNHIENFEGYLYFSVKNQCLNQLKKNKREKKIFTPLDLHDCKTGEYSQPLEQLLNSELRDKIAECVDRLPQKRRLVYKMIKDDGLKIKEVSKLLDIAEKTVKKHLELAVRDLRTEIATYICVQNNYTKIIPIPLKACSLVMLVMLIPEFFGI